jgi:hypothetical protein
MKNTQTLMIGLAENLKLKYAEQIIEVMQIKDAAMIHDAWVVRPSRIFGVIPGHLVKLPIFKDLLTGGKKALHVLDVNDPYDAKLAAYEFSNPRKFKQINLAREGYKIVTDQYPQTRNALKSAWYTGWHQVKRGRDVFVKGMGTFDLKARITHYFDNNENQHYGYYHMLTLPNLRASGYYPGENGYYADRMFRTKKFLTYLVRWKSVLPASRFDELTQSRHFNLREHFRVSPDRLLPRLRELRSKEFDETELVKYDWLTDLEDLKVCKTNHELRSIGALFNNCAGGYTGMVRRKKCIIVYSDIAMGELGRNGNWRQVEGPSHQQANRETWETFTKHTDQLMEMLK